MAKLLPYFKMYPADVETDENFRLMSYEQRGLYWTLLDHAWLNDGLPNDIEDVQHLAQLSKIDFDRMWKRVSKCFILVDGRLINSRQEKERFAAIGKSIKATDAVRSRYVRSTDVPIRAYVSVSVSESIEDSTKEDDEMKPAALPLGDDTFDQFRAAYLLTGRATTQDDWNDATYAWRKLDGEQKFAAITAIKEFDGDSGFLKLPRRWMDAQEWTRPKRTKRTRNGNSAEELALL